MNKQKLASTICIGDVKIIPFTYPGREQILILNEVSDFVFDIADLASSMNI